MIEVEVGAATLACLVDGPERGPVILCAHGFPDCARSFRAQTAPLVARGFRVVAPYLRGYAPSTPARDGRYDAAALGADLCALAAHFSTERVRLIGHDWGAIAAYAATALAPARFSHLCTLAVPHLRACAPRFLRPSQLRKSWYMGLFQLRGLAERRLAEDDFALVERLWRDWSPGFTPPQGELAAIKRSIAAPDHLSAVLGYYRALLSPAAIFGESRRLLFRRTSVPALYLHGEDDGCVGVELSNGIETAYSSGVRVHRVPSCGHFLHQERPDEVNRLLLGFLA
ncbi:MAG: alpha/beta fold hydrolase [Polyangia bacterium]